MKFNRIEVLRKRLQLETKTILTMTAFFLELFKKICFVLLTSYVHGLKLV